jgi:hypothetical protein
MHEPLASTMYQYTAEEIAAAILAQGFDDEHLIIIADAVSDQIGSRSARLGY